MEIRRDENDPSPGSRSFNRQYTQKSSLSPSVDKPINPLPITHDELINRAQGTVIDMNENHEKEYDYHMGKHIEYFNKKNGNKADFHVFHAQEAERHAMLHHKQTGKKIYDPRYTGDSSHITDIKEEVLDEATGHVAIVKKALAASGHGMYPDSIAKNKEGHVIIRKSYFHHNGGSSTMLARRVTDALTAAGVKHEIVKHGNHFVPFRGGASTAKGSHWHVHVKLHENNLQEDLSSPYHRVAQHIKSHYPEMKSNVDAWHNDVNNGGDDTEAFHRHFGNSKHRDWLHSVMHNHGIPVDFIHKEDFVVTEEFKPGDKVTYQMNKKTRGDDVRHLGETTLSILDFNKDTFQRTMAEKAASKIEESKQQVASNLLDESSSLHIKHGAFHRWLGKSENEPITAADIAKGKAAGGHAEKMAIFAQNFGHVHENHEIITDDKITESESIEDQDHAELKHMYTWKGHKPIKIQKFGQHHYIINTNHKTDGRYYHIAYHSNKYGLHHSFTTKSPKELAKKLEIAKTENY